MSVSSAVAARRAAAQRRRSDRAIAKAVAKAATPGMRDELLLVSQRAHSFR